MNLLQETLSIMDTNSLTPSQVLFVNVPEFEAWEYEFTTNLFDDDVVIEAYSLTWEQFTSFAESNFSNYDNGYGGAEVPPITIVFSDGAWLERREYDGSEWWEYKQLPKQFPGKPKD